MGADRGSFDPPDRESDGLAEAVAPTAASTPTEVPREARSLLALVEQRAATGAAKQGAVVQWFGQDLVQGNRQRIHSNDIYACGLTRAGPARKASKAAGRPCARSRRTHRGDVLDRFC